MAAGNWMPELVVLLFSLLTEMRMSHTSNLLWRAYDNTPLQMLRGMMTMP